MKHVLSTALLVLMSITMVQTMAAQISDKRAENIEWRMRNMTSLGVEIGKVNLSGDYGTEGVWFGRNVDLAGVYTIGYMNGQGTYIDSSRTVHTNGKLVYMGMQNMIPLFKSNIFDIAPLYGLGMQINEMQNNAKYEEQGEDNALGTLSIGGYISAGVSIVVGPLVVKAKYTGIAGFNFNKSNMIKSSQWYPSLSVGIKPGRLLLNPYMFSSDGLRYRQDVIDEKITRDPLTKDLTYSATVRTSFNEGSVNIMDVRPYVFLGPEYITGNASASVGNSSFVGLVGGFRFGTVYMDVSLAKGDMPFRDPIKDYRDLQRISPIYGKPRMDGYFKNSTRYGAKVGVDLVALVAKSDFIPYGNSSSFTQATSFYAAMVTFGFGQMKFGQLSYYYPGADTTYASYLNQMGETSAYNAIPATATRFSDQLKFISVGFSALIGTVGFDWNLFYFKGSGGYARWGKEASISWKLPIVRAFRIGKVMKLEKRMK